MSRLASTIRPRSQSPNYTSRDLTRLLERLAQTVLSPEGERRLRRSSYQRSKVGFNVEHARSLLLKLEHEGGSSSAASSKKTSQATDLQQKRVSLKKLQDRLFELNQQGDEDASESEGNSTEDDAEDLVDRYAPAVKHTYGAINVDAAPRAPPDASIQAATNIAGTLESTLRSRRNREQALAADSATATGRAGAVPGVPGATTPFAPKQVADRLSDNETLLAHHTAEQESITDSLLALATALKDSTMSFSDTLAASNPLVDRTVGALDKNVGGMEAAEKRMGMLRRITEGKGWWARLSLWAWIGILWVVLILLMFVVPKLRIGRGW